jgi:hypothetical protein
MKKIVLLLSALALGFISCSKSDAPAALNSNGLLPIKIITSSGANIVDTSEYTYNGNKLVQITSSGGGYSQTYAFTYTNDLITGSIITRNTGVVNNVTYTYNSANNLVQILNLIPSLNKGVKSVFTYNADGTVSQADFSGDLTSQTTNTGDYKVFFQNGLVTKRERYRLINSVMETETTNYTYDTKNYIFNAILGYNKMELDFSTSHFGVLNNIVSYAYSATNTTMTSTSSSVYTYNLNNYPITKTDTYSSGGPTTASQIFYQ